MKGQTYLRFNNKLKYSFSSVIFLVECAHFMSVTPGTVLNMTIGENETKIKEQGLFTREDCLTLIRTRDDEEGKSNSNSFGKT